MRQPLHYPFSALVGSDDLALALALAAVSPAVGGVLVRGEKGTAKSTAVRALTSLLPPVLVVDDCRFSCDPAAPGPGCPDGPHGPDATSHERPARLVELPVGASEDRLVGALHLGKALAEGVTEYEPGLLAAAHRGLLYVDEVNLLHDHLVDALLDAAAMGRSTVEREGVSVTHPASFVLVGTMNPEEGELRPQLLDRFGLSVDVAAPRDPALRVEVVRRRLAFDADPVAFHATWAEQEQQLADRIAAARGALPDVVLGDAALTAIAELCAAFDVDGLRADLVTARTAVAHAAWCGRTEVTLDDVRAAARLAVPHRRRRTPFDEPDRDEQVMDDVLGPPQQQEQDGPDDEPDPDPDGPGEPPSGHSDGDDGDDGGDDGGDGGGDQQPSSSGASDEPTTTTSAGEPARARLLTAPGQGTGTAGRRSRAITTRGRTVGARPDPEAQGPVHLLATLGAAARRARPTGTRARVERSDLRARVTEGRESNLVLLCVDASGSMAARKRVEQVGTAVLSLLLDAYQRRDKVGLVTFRGTEATVVVPPTGSVDLAASRVRAMPAGGRTPLAEGLARAAEVLRVERLKDPHRRPLLVVVTDGRANTGPDAVRRAHLAADHLRAAGVPAVVVDSETGRFRMGLAHELAERLGAEHVPLGEVTAGGLVTEVRRRAA